MPVAILRRKPVAQSSCNRWERASASTLATQRRVEAFVKAHGGQCSSGGLPVEQRTWEWRACPALPTFSKQRFCELLRGNLLLVGDSLTGTFTKALTVLLEATVLSRTAGTSEWLACGNRRLVYRRNDALDLASHYSGGLLADGRGHACGRRQPPLPAGGPAAVALANATSRGVLLCNPWSAEIRAADVLVLNAGAHGVPDDGYVSLMRLASQFARQQRRPGALHLFRNTPFGHHNCSLTKHAPPLPSLRAAELALAREPQYDWLAFKRRNQLAEPIFTAQANPNPSPSPNPDPSPSPNPNPNPRAGWTAGRPSLRSRPTLQRGHAARVPRVKAASVARVKAAS